MTDANDERPFAGLKVFDVTQGVAGPHGTMLLALHGADVIKVEPLSGDWGRAIGKAYGDLCAHFMAFNRGKRSIAVDLKSDGGRVAAQQLAYGADIVVESFPPGVMAKFGLDYDAVKAANPDVIYCSINGFGQSGPAKDRKVSDTIIQAFSGFMPVNADANGVPRALNMIPIDVLTGLYVYQAISAAVLKRFRFRKGAYIDCNLMQSAASFLSAKITEFVLEDGQPQLLSVPAGTMPTADGFINVSVVKQEHFEGLCEALDQPDLITDPRFVDREMRLAHAAEIMALVRAEFQKRPTAAWAERLTDAGVMFEPVNDFAAFLADPQVAAMGAVVRTDYPGAPDVPVVAIPGMGAPVPGTRDATVPHLGEHTRAILAEAGYEDTDIDALIAASATADHVSD